MQLLLILTNLCAPCKSVWTTSLSLSSELGSVGHWTCLNLLMLNGEVTMSQQKAVGFDLSNVLNLQNRHNGCSLTLQSTEWHLGWGKGPTVQCCFSKARKTPHTPVPNSLPHADSPGPTHAPEFTTLAKGQSAHDNWLSPTLPRA